MSMPPKPPRAPPRPVVLDIAPALLAIAGLALLTTPQPPSASLEWLAGAMLLLAPVVWLLTQVAVWGADGGFGSPVPHTAPHAKVYVRPMRDTDVVERLELELIARRAVAIVHEFGSLLVPIQRQLSSNALANGADPRLNLERVLDAVDRAAAIAADLVAVSRDQAPASDPDLNRVVAALANAATANGGASGEAIAAFAAGDEASSEAHPWLPSWNGAARTAVGPSPSRSRASP